MESIYYDGTTLLNTKDINKGIPEIYISTGNRTAGKTTYFNRYVVNRFIKHGEKFIILYRYSYECKGCAEKFFSDIQGLFFKGYTMTEKTFFNGIFTRLYLNDVVCGYALALNDADKIKKYSHLFTDAKRFLFDEFQPESNVYLPDEISKFQSVHMSVARGQGQLVRYVPVIMISNFVTLLNPYYIAFGISERLRDDTKILRGDGFVLEQTLNVNASKAQQESAFNRAFKDSQYLKYASEIKYLNDNTAFIEKPNGHGTYLCTIKCEGKEYGIINYDTGYIYVSDRADSSFRVKISLTVDDHNVGYVLANQYAGLIMTLRQCFQKGYFRFKNLQCKSVAINLLKY